jgi:hypothetical protein
MTKKIAILQSNYIPWKGYFDLINNVDEFILFDDMQYTKNDWRNRNKIKTAKGSQWLTIPVRQEKLSQIIKDTKVIDSRWQKKHWATISQNYSKAKYFKDYKDVFEELYLKQKYEYLSLVNYSFIVQINNILGIKTKLRWSSEFELLEGKTEKLLSICKDCDASEYVSGPAAKDYFDIKLAQEYAVNVSWVDYSGYDEYQQSPAPFDHAVSILDLIFNEGPNATKYMKTFSNV